MKIAVRLDAFALQFIDKDLVYAEAAISTVGAVVQIVDDAVMAKFH